MKNQSNNQKVILVTGGAGYVGSILVRKLLYKGYRVICLDVLNFGGQSLLDIWGHPDFIFKKVDITHFDEVKKVLSKYKIDGIVHLAAIVGDPACKLQPELAQKTNFDASENLLILAKNFNIPRFIFASTCSNYGKMKDPNGFVDETSLLNPVSLYAELKVAFEQKLLVSCKSQNSIAPTVLRFATVYGISPRMRFDLTVNEFTKEIALNRELLIFGEQFWRPYCHVSDFSSAILLILESPIEKVSHKIFNVGDTAQNFTKKMVVDEIRNIVTDAKIRYVKKDEDPRDYKVNFEKIKNELGFQISKTVPDGIKEILSCIQLGIIRNPEDQVYYNIPK